MASVFGKPRAGGGQQSAPLEVNLAILGRRGAGKSALTVKFLTRRFISEYDPNLEDTYSSEETVDHQPVHLRVMDTADLDTPRNCERYLNWAHAFLVVYSVDSRQSFEGSSSYLELLALHAKETQRSFPALLLGNKLDMAQYRKHHCDNVETWGQPEMEENGNIRHGAIIPFPAPATARPDVAPRGWLWVDSFMRPS